MFSISCKINGKIKNSESKGARFQNPPNHPQEPNYLMHLLQGME
jgi:hypothetical protein